MPDSPAQASKAQASKAQASNAWASNAQAAQDAALAVAYGEPTPAELAAVVVVLGSTAGARARAAACQPQRSRWAARDRLIRSPLVAGPGAWRASALPR